MNSNIIMIAFLVYFLVCYVIQFRYMTKFRSKSDNIYDDLLEFIFISSVSIGGFVMVPLIKPLEYFNTYYYVNGAGK